MPKKGKKAAPAATETCCTTKKCSKTKMAIIAVVLGGLGYFGYTQGVFDKITGMFKSETPVEAPVEAPIE